MRPPPPSRHSGTSSEARPSPEPEQRKKFREALEKGQRAPLAEEHTDTKAWPPLTAEQQHQAQRLPRVNCPQVLAQGVLLSHFERVQAQQHEERLHEQQREEEVRQKKQQEQDPAAAAKSEAYKALEGIGGP